MWTFMSFKGLSNMWGIMRTQLQALMFGLCRLDNAEMTQITQTSGKMISLGNTIYLLIVSRMATEFQNCDFLICRLMIPKGLECDEYG